MNTVVSMLERAAVADQCFQWGSLLDMAFPRCLFPREYGRCCSLGGFQSRAAVVISSALRRRLPPCSQVISYLGNSFSIIFHLQPL